MPFEMRFDILLISLV